MKKLNSLGISHLLLPILVVAVIAVVGGAYMLVSSSAASNPRGISKYGTIKVENRISGGKVKPYTVYMTKIQKAPMNVKIGGKTAERRAEGLYVIRVQGANKKQVRMNVTTYDLDAGSGGIAKSGNRVVTFKR